MSFSQVLCAPSWGTRPARVKKPHRCSEEEKNDGAVAPDCPGERPSQVGEGQRRAPESTQLETPKCPPSPWSLATGSTTTQCFLKVNRKDL